MSLSVGIVGLPNVGKSTLFNALLKRQQAYVANFPFATIEPNVGVVPVPDERLEKLADVIEMGSSAAVGITSRPQIVPATVQFVDIAGLIAGAHKGEGLGNKFLSHIRETDAICHVVRFFSDNSEVVIKQGVIDPATDFETVETELKLADFQTLESQMSKLKSQNETSNLKMAIGKLYNSLQKGVAAREVSLTDEERKYARQFSLLTAKPILVVLNVDEKDLKDAVKLEIEYAEKFNLHTSQVIAVSAKTESELSDLNESDQKRYLEDLGVKESGLERLVKKAFETLGLITFLTAGEKEVRAWTIRRGSTALIASGVIHTDFIKKFIKADVVDFDDFIRLRGWKNCRELGKVRSEGRDYEVKDGDVIEFRVGS
jgi:hypothetical protein